MAREFFKRLVAVFNCAKADSRVALRLGWMQLTKRDHRLVIVLRVKRDGGPKPRRIVITIRPVVELDQCRSFNTTKFHPAAKLLTIRCDHVEAPKAADANVDLLRLDLKTGWSKPVRQMLRVGPGGKHQVAPHIYHPRENNFAIERPL